MHTLCELPNIGPETARQLQQVGIHTAAELRACGATAAWLRILQIDDSACMNRLLGLEGAVQGIPKKLLSEQRRAELRAFYQQHKAPR